MWKCEKTAKSSSSHLRLAPKVSPPLYTPVLGAEINSNQVLVLIPAFVTTVRGVIFFNKMILRLKVSHG